MATETKLFSYEELAKHNTAEDLWMVIDGKVYDCTAFLDEHPGGEEVMIDCGGIDATGPFDDVGHSEEAREALEPMLVGSIDTSSAPVSAQGAGSSATTGGEQNIGLIIGIVIALLAIIVYLLFLS